MKNPLAKSAAVGSLCLDARVESIVKVLGYGSMSAPESPVRYSTLPNGAFL